MISKEFFKALEQVAEERDVPKEKILDIFGKGLLNAYKKDYRGQQNARVLFNEEKAEILIVATYLVVDTVDPEAEKRDSNHGRRAQEFKKNARVGDIIEVKITPKILAIAALKCEMILTQGLEAA